MSARFDEVEPGLFHPGEVTLQRRQGMAEQLARVGGRMVRDHMPEPHRAFFAQLPFLIAGAVDPDGTPWATVWTGPPGFAHAPEPRVLSLRVAPDAADPASAGLRAGAAVGLLGIELETRRRNRMNGALRLRPGGFDVAVEHSFGNCPQHIQRRGAHAVRRAAASSGAALVSNELTAAARRLIRAADTFFVASYVDLPQGRQVDVSHRGGPPGFVHLSDAGVLTIPDYSGNNLFNTLGNFTLNPLAGLLFMDFERGGLLQLTGRVEVLWDTPEIAAFAGAERLWRFTPTRLVQRG